MLACVESDVHAGQGPRVREASVHRGRRGVGVLVAAAGHVDPDVGVGPTGREGGAVVVDRSPWLYCILYKNSHRTIIHAIY